MDWLEGLPCSDTGKPEEKGERDNTESQREGHDLYTDPGLLSYIDELCSQEDFVKQLVEKRLLALKNEQGLQELSAALLPVGQSAERDDCGPRRGVGSQNSPSQISSSDRQGHGVTNAEMPEPKPATVLPVNQWSPSLGDTQLTAAPCGHGSYTQDPGLRGASPTGEAPESVGMNNKVREELPSLSFLLSSSLQLVPWRLSHSLGPHSGLSDPVGVPQPSPPQRRGLSPDPPPSPKSKTQAVIGGLAPVIQMSSPRPNSEVSKVSPALELACPSEPQKRKRESLGTRKRKRKKRH